MMDAYHFQLNILGKEVGVRLSSTKKPHLSQNSVEFQGVKYSVEISGLPEDPAKTQALMHELREALAHPQTTLNNLPETLLARGKRKTVEAKLMPARVPSGESIPFATLEERMRDYKVPAVSLTVIDQGKVAWSAGYGQIANKEGTPISCSSHTQFQCASVGKSITAVAILKLAQEHKVDLDADVNTYLTSWKLKPRKEAKEGEKVTLRMLLTHTAGINVEGFAGFIPGSELPTSTVDLLNGNHSGVNEMAGKPIEAIKEPGIAWEYSGGGYLILQQVVEDVWNKDKEEKKPFSQIIQTIIFEPLGMENSFYAIPSENMSVASAHKADGTVVEGNYHIYPEQGAAGFWTTSEELAKFLQEIQHAFQNNSGKVLTSETAKMMLEPIMTHTNSGEEVAAGLGVGIDRYGPFTSFMHTGHNEGYQSIMVGIAETGKGAVILTNGENGNDLISEIIGTVADTFDWPKEMKPTPLEVIFSDPTTFKAYEGQYKVEDPEHPEFIEVHAREEKLYSQTPLLPFAARLYQTALDKFVILETGEEYTFIRNSEGRVDSIRSNLTDLKISKNF